MPKSIFLSGFGLSLSAKYCNSRATSPCLAFTVVVSAFTVVVSAFTVVVSAFMFCAMVMAVADSNNAAIANALVKRALCGRGVCVVILIFSLLRQSCFEPLVRIVIVKNCCKDNSFFLIHLFLYEEKRKYDIFWVKTEQSLKTMKCPLLCFIKGVGGSIKVGTCKLLTSKPLSSFP